MQALTDFLLPLFLALGSLWFVVDLVKKLRAPAPRSEPATATAPAQLPSASAPPTSAPAPYAPAEPAPPLPHSLTPSPALTPAPILPAEHLAVIAATIHHLYRGRARIAAVVAATPGHHSAVDWAREGRRDIFSSHRLR